MLSDHVFITFGVGSILFKIKFKTDTTKKMQSQDDVSPRRYDNRTTIDFRADDAASVMASFDDSGD